MILFRTTTPQETLLLRNCPKFPELFGYPLIIGIILSISRQAWLMTRPVFQAKLSTHEVMTS